MPVNLSEDTPRMGQLVLVGNDEKASKLSSDFYLTTKLQAPKSGMTVKLDGGEVREFAPGEEFYVAFTFADFGRPVRRVERQADLAPHTSFVRDMVD